MQKHSRSRWALGWSLVLLCALLLVVLFWQDGAPSDPPRPTPSPQDEIEHSGQNPGGAPEVVDEGGRVRQEPDAHEVRIRVLAEVRGTPLPGLPVQLRACGPGDREIRSRADLVSRFGDQLAEITDSNGAVEFEAGVAGPYNVFINDRFVYVVRGGSLRIPRQAETHIVTAQVGGEIVGTVFSDNGAPVEDCVVYANVGLSRSFSGGHITGRPSALDSSGERIVRTDATGRFTIPGIPIGAGVHVIALHPSFVNGSVRVRCERGRQTVVAPQIHLTRGQALTVTVAVDEEGGELPVSGATVLVRPQAGSVSLPVDGTTDDSGRVVIRPLAAEKLELITTAPGYAAAREMVDLTAGETKRQVTVLLLRARSIRGMVTESGSGKPIPDAIVDAKLRFPNARLSLSKMLRRTLKTDRQGKFKIPFIPRKPVELSCRKKGYESVYRMKVASGEAEVEIRLAHKAVIRGRVSLRDGRAPGTFRVLWAREGEARWLGRRQFAGTDGRFEFACPKLSSYVLLATAGGASGSVRARSGRPGSAGSEVDVVITSDPDLRGAAFDAVTGQPLEGARVHASLVLDSPRAGASSLFAPILDRLVKAPVEQRQAKTNSAGRFTLSMGVALPIRLRVESDGYESSVQTLKDLTAPFDLGRIELRPLRSFRGMVKLDGTQGVPLNGKVYAFRGDSSFPVAWGDVAAGKFTLELPEGVKLLRVTSLSGANSKRLWSLEQAYDGKQTDGLFVVPRETHELTGGIVGASGNALPDVEVHVTRKIEKARAWEPGAPWKKVTSDERGQFRLPGLADGHYALTCRVGEDVRRQLVSIGNKNAEYVVLDFRPK